MKRIFVFLLCLASLSGLFAQSEGISINSNGNDPDPSAILDVQSDNKGLLIPRLTTEQRNGIASPAAGLYIYNLDDSCFNYFTGETWILDCGMSSDLDKMLPTSQGSPTSSTQTRLLTEGPNNTLYIVGYFVNTLTLGSFNLTGTGATDYLAQYNPVTQEYLWAKTIDPPGGAAEIEDLTADGSGNIYITGSLNSSTNSYIMKFSASGTQEWIYQPTGTVDFNVIEGASNDQVYFGGRILSIVDWGGFTYTDPGSTPDAVIGKLTSNGTLDWVQPGWSLNTTDNGSNILDIVVDDQDNLYAAGGLNGTFLFGNPPVSVTSTGSLFNPYIAKFDAQGTAIWGRLFPTTNNGLAMQIGLDQAGNLYTSGFYLSDLDVDGISLSPTTGTGEFFVEGLDACGHDSWE